MYVCVYVRLGLTFLSMCFANSVAVEEIEYPYHVVVITADPHKILTVIAELHLCSEKLES
jgi:hypothetical protein